MVAARLVGGKMFIQNVFFYCSMSYLGEGDGIGRVSRTVSIAPSGGGAIGSHGSSVIKSERSGAIDSGHGVSDDGS